MGDEITLAVIVRDFRPVWNVVVAVGVEQYLTVRVCDLPLRTSRESDGDVVGGGVLHGKPEVERGCD